MTRTNRSAARRHIEDELERIADELESISALQTTLYEKRLALWLEGRALEPPLMQRELAIPSRVTEGAVTQALRKHHQQGR